MSLNFVVMLGLCVTVSVPDNALDARQDGGSTGSHNAVMALVFFWFAAARVT